LPDASFLVALERETASGEKGRAAAREGRLLDHDDVAARMGRRYRG
jgi:hypothetical protein